MRKIILAIIISIVFVGPIEAVTIGKSIQTKVYNDALKIWIPSELTMHAGKVYDKDTIIFIAYTNSQKTQAHMYYTTENVKKLKKAIEKAIKWTKIAKKNKANVSKKISCILFNEFKEDCQFGTGVIGPGDKNSVHFDFFSNNNGSQTDLVINITHWDNKFIQTELYLDPDNVKQLLANINQIDKAFEQNRQEEKNKNLFN